MVTIPFSALLLHFLLDLQLTLHLLESSTRDSPVRLELPDGGDQVLCLSCPSGACSPLHRFLIRRDVEKWFSDCFLSQELFTLLKLTADPFCVFPPVVC